LTKEIKVTSIQNKMNGHRNQIPQLEHIIKREKLEKRNGEQRGEPVEEVTFSYLFP